MNKVCATCKYSSIQPIKSMPLVCINKYSPHYMKTVNDYLSCEKWDHDVVLEDDRIHLIMNDRRTLEFVPKARYDDLIHNVREAVSVSRQYADRCLDSGQDTSLTISEQTNYFGKRSGILFAIDELRERIPELESSVPEAKDVQDAQIID